MFNHSIYFYLFNVCWVIINNYTDLSQQIKITFASFIWTYFTHVLFPLNWDQSASLQHQCSIIQLALFSLINIYWKSHILTDICCYKLLFIIIHLCICSKMAITSRISSHQLLSIKLLSISIINKNLLPVDWFQKQLVFQKSPNFT